MALFAESLPVASTAFDLPKISLALRNATVRDILDAIVGAHGEAGWTVQYRHDAPDRVPRMSILLRTFDNTNRSIAVPLR
jgi:hypothetical protein